MDVDPPTEPSVTTITSVLGALKAYQLIPGWATAALTHFISKDLGTGWKALLLGWVGYEGTDEWVDEVSNASPSQHCMSYHVFRCIRTVWKSWGVAHRILLPGLNVDGCSQRIHLGKATPVSMSSRPM